VDRRRRHQGHRHLDRDTCIRPDLPPGHMARAMEPSQPTGRRRVSLVATEPIEPWRYCLVSKPSMWPRKKHRTWMTASEVRKCPYFTNQELIRQSRRGDGGSPTGIHTGLSPIELSYDEGMNIQAQTCINSVTTSSRWVLAGSSRCLDYSRI
jgi:hypothetical protein